MCVLMCFICTFNLFMCLIIKQLQLYLHFVSFRFVSLLRFAFVCSVSNRQIKLLFWPLFWPFRAFSCRFCVFVCADTKGRYFGRFCASNFRYAPSPLSTPTATEAAFPKIFFQNFFFPPCPSCQFYFFFIFFYFFQHC